MRRGFTFLEMTLVIGLLFLMAGVTIPRVSTSLKSQQVRTFREDVGRLFADARNLARSSGQTVYVQVGESGQLQLVQGDQDQPLRSIAVPEGMNLDDFELLGDPVSESEWQVGYYGDGKVDTAAFSINEGDVSRTYRILSTGVIREVGDDEYQDPEEKWEAGEIVQRGSN